MLIVSRGTIRWEELRPESLCRYLVRWISNEVHGRGLVVGNTDAGCLGGVYGFRRYSPISHSFFDAEHIPA